MINRQAKGNVPRQAYLKFEIILIIVKISINTFVFIHENQFPSPKNIFLIFKMLAIRVWDEY